MRKAVWLIFFFWLIINGLFIVWDYFTSPICLNTTVFIQPGWSIKRAVYALSKRGVIKHPFLFFLWAKIKGRNRTIKAGEYAITPNLTPAKLLDYLFTGTGLVRYKVTIPEGSTIKQIAHILAQKRLVDERRFCQLAFNPAFASRLGINASSLEGYLFPTTYFFERLPHQERHIIEVMVQEFNRHYQKYAPKAMQKCLSREEVVTIASIVEKETASKEERPLIASVYLNRLQRHMPLQADPTIIYVLPNFKGKLTHKDLQIPSPYNTYLHKGLPPTPICNPGEDSLKAVVEAPKTPYLYFVSMGNGRHYFSTNLKEHRRAIERYLKRHGHLSN